MQRRNKSLATKKTQSSRNSTAKVTDNIKKQQQKSNNNLAKKTTIKPKTEQKKTQSQAIVFTNVCLPVCAHIFLVSHRTGFACCMQKCGNAAKTTTTTTNNHTNN